MHSLQCLPQSVRHSRSTQLSPNGPTDHSTLGQKEKEHAVHISSSVPSMWDVLTRSSRNSTGTSLLWALVWGTGWAAFTAPHAKREHQDVGMSSAAEVPQGNFYSSAIVVTFLKVKIYMFVLTGVSWPNPDWGTKKKKKNKKLT